MTDQAEPAQAEPAQAEPAGSTLARRANVLLAAALVLLVACAGFAVWFGIGWANASSYASDEDSQHYSQVRDEVRRVGVGAVQTFTTVDYRHPDNWVRGVTRYTTGDLQKYLSGRGKQYKKLMTDSQASTNAKLLGSAVTALSLKEGSAEVVVAADTVRRTKRNPQPDTQRRWFQLELVQTGDGWKVSTLNDLTRDTQPR